MLDQSGPLVLVVEDEFLIAVGYEEEVRAAFIRLGGPFPSSKLALEWLEGHTPDMAILNVLLADRDFMPVVETLRHRGIPWVLVTGMPRESISASFQDGRWLSKPCSWFHLHQHLQGMRDGLRPTAEETKAAERSQMRLVAPRLR